MRKYGKKMGTIWENVGNMRKYRKYDFWWENTWRFIATWLEWDLNHRTRDFWRFFSPVGYYQRVLQYNNGDVTQISWNICSPYRTSIVVTIYLLIEWNCSPEHGTEWLLCFDMYQNDIQWYLMTSRDIYQHLDEVPNIE